jgi:hypothetical protein
MGYTMRRLLLILPLLVTVSCSSGTTSGILALLTGNWAGVMLSTSPPPPGFSGNITMSITQDEFGFITGIINISDPETNCWIGGILLEGSSITGSRVVLSWVDNSGATVTVDATATNNSISGLYNSTAPSGAEAPEPVPTPLPGGGPTTTPPAAVVCTASSGTFNVNRSG